jgi:hypothetical protein
MHGQAGGMQLMCGRRAAAAQAHRSQVVVRLRQLVGLPPGIRLQLLHLRARRGRMPHAAGQAAQQRADITSERRHRRRQAQAAPGTRYKRARQALSSLPCETMRDAGRPVCALPGSAWLGVAPSQAGQNSGETQSTVALPAAPTSFSSSCTFALVSLRDLERDALPFSAAQQAARAAAVFSGACRR